MFRWVMMFERCSVVLFQWLNEFLRSLAHIVMSRSAAHCYILLRRLQLYWETVLIQEGFCCRTCQVISLMHNYLSMWPMLFSWGHVPIWVQFATRIRVKFCYISALNQVTYSSVSIVAHGLNVDVKFKTECLLRIMRLFSSLLIDCEPCSQARCLPSLEMIFARLWNFL
jgi:hypothetical protein